MRKIPRRWRGRHKNQGTRDKKGPRIEVPEGK